MSDFQVRRATVEDLPALRQLWQAAGLNVAELEKRLTEFQVVESSTGQPVGAIAIHIAGKHARLHSEAFDTGNHADDFRARLWNRINAVAVNHGLVRLWTQEPAPYWHQNGFVPAAGDVLQKLPAAFAGIAGDWLTRQLREETAAPPASVEREFEMFKQAQLEERAHLMKRAKAVKVLAAIVSVILLVILAVAAVVFFKRQPPPRLPGGVAPPAAPAEPSPAPPTK